MRLCRSRITSRFRGGKTSGLFTGELICSINRRMTLSNPDPAGTRLYRVGRNLGQATNQQAER
jgi:hypothetical protein